MTSRTVQVTALTKLGRRDDDHVESRPLDFRLIARLVGYMRPYARHRNWLIVAVALRAIQLPALTWILAEVINGPIQRGDVNGVAWGAAIFAAVAIFTQVTMHIRQRYALELGEVVVFEPPLHAAAAARTAPMPSETTSHRQPLFLILNWFMLIPLFSFACPAPGYGGRTDRPAAIP